MIEVKDFQAALRELRDKGDVLECLPECECVWLCDVLVAVVAVAGATRPPVTDGLEPLSRLVDKNLVLLLLVLVEI